MTPSLAELAPPTNHPLESRIVKELAASRLLPEAYIYGLVDIGRVAKSTPTFLFGEVYAHGRWFYFPAALLVKSTLGLLGLLLLLPFAQALRERSRRREVIFLAVPCSFYLLVAMSSGLNLGVRHILPIYPFLVLLLGYTAWSLIKQNRRWGYAVLFLMCFHIVSSIRTFPNYIPYSNEIFGGPNNTYKLLAESNVDVGQGLKELKQYVDRNHVKDCWFADYALVVAADPTHYGIPCKLLPTSLNKFYDKPMDLVPRTIDGPIFIGASELSGRVWGPGEMNPYLQFQRVRPNASIAGSILLFEGRFDLPLASAISHSNRASHLLDSNRLDEALVEARAAAALAPNNVEVEVVLGDVLSRLNRNEEAERAFRTALSLARQDYPEFQERWISPISSRLATVSSRLAMDNGI